MAKEKACLNCKRIYEGDKCPACENTQSSENFKGRLHVFNPEESEIAKKVGIKKAGEYAIKSK